MLAPSSNGVIQAAVVPAFEVQSKLVLQLACAATDASSSCHVAASSFIHVGGAVQVPTAMQAASAVCELSLQELVSV